jgi:hypothetical protein
MKKSTPCNRPWRPIGLWDVEAPTYSTQSAHRWWWGCQPYTPAALNPPGRFLVLISIRGWVDPRTIVRLEGLGQLINPMTSSGIEPATSRLLSYCLKYIHTGKCKVNPLYEPWYVIYFVGNLAEGSRMYAWISQRRTNIEIFVGNRI